MTLKNIIEGRDTRAGRVFDFGVQAFIVVSLISFSLETLPNLSKQWQFWLYVIEVATVALFTIEYLLRVLVAESRLGFVFSFYGLVDLTAVLPFYISTGVDLRSVRILRLFRVFRVFKFFRYTEAIRRFREAFADIKEELVIFLLATVFVLFLSSVGIYYFERDAQPEQFASIFHCMWWSIVTLTTVGYGDVYPVTLGGKVFTTVILIIGLGVVAVPTGLFASALTRTDHAAKSDRGTADVEESS
ncbi:MAG TPA: ion transporter [Thermoguttaceae bacterium]|nr:ion transporter [Thermoguttaceae bacterium]